MPSSPQNLASAAVCFGACIPKGLLIPAWIALLIDRIKKNGHHPVTPTTYNTVAFHENDGVLRVFTSSDGLTFTEVSETYSDAAPLRTPSIIYYYGKYWCAYTLSVGGPTNPPVFGLATSLDGITWSKVGNVSCGISGKLFLVDPSWFIDPADSSIHVIMNMSSGGAFNFYEMHPTAVDMTTWSAAALVATSAVSRTGVFMDFYGGIYYAWFRNMSTGYIELAGSLSPFLPAGYGPIGSGNWSGWGLGAGGGYYSPSVIHLPNGKLRVYLDDTISNGIFYSESSDYLTWTALQPVVFNNPSSFVMSGPDVRILTTPI